MMLHCNMDTDLRLELELDDLLADLRHARRQGDLGRLALLAYCEVRRWARSAGQPALALHSAEMITGNPHVSREAFIDRVDGLISELECLRPAVHGPAADAVAVAALKALDSAGEPTPR